MSYEYSLKVALEHSRAVFSELDGCSLDEVGQFHPDDKRFDKQIDLFGGLESEMSVISI